MKKSTKLGLFLFLGMFLGALWVLLSPLPVASSQGEKPLAYEVNLGIEHPGLLPSNPFYFVKEWTRNVRRAMIFRETKKADLELVILNERAAEIARLAAIVPDNKAVLNSALIAYEVSAQGLLNQLLSKNYRESGQLDNLLSRITEMTLKHYLILSSLPEAEPAFTGGFGGHSPALNKSLAVLAAVLADDPTNVSGFVSQVRKITSLNKQPWQSLRYAEALNRLAAQLPLPLQPKIFHLKEDLLLNFAVEARANSFPLLLAGLVPGDLVTRLVSLDELRAKIDDREFKNQLSLIRQGVLRKLEEDRQISSQAIDQLVNQAKVIAGGLESQKSLPVSAKGLLNQTKFYFDQVASFKEQAQEGAALGQASLALASAKGAAYSTWVAREDYENELDFIKNTYDGLVSAGGDQERLAAVERKIASLADFIQAVTASGINEKTETLLFNVKLELLSIAAGTGQRR